MEDAGATPLDAGADLDAGLGCGQAPTAPTEVRTAFGNVLGTAEGGVIRFRGIPFAAPPLGALRFAPPAPPACAASPLNAADYGPACAQVDADGKLLGAEDCLTLNVFTPALTATAAMPVLFFIHGGGNISGSARLTAADGTLVYDGTALAKATRSVVVTVQYRLNAFGFLTHPAVGAGNLGLLDQIAALRYVAANIQAFGGDPSRVLVFGESAGAVDTCMLVASPAARGLFSAALMESGACVASPKATREMQGQEVVMRAGCADAPDVLACLRGLSTEALALAKPGVINLATGTIADYGPTIDGTILPAAPLTLIKNGQHNAVPMIIGSNLEETFEGVPAIPSCAAYESNVRMMFPVLGDTVLGLYPCAAYPSPRLAFTDLTTDARFTCNARRAARAVTGAGGAVWRYHFVQHLEASRVPMLAVHGMELAFVFGTLGIAGYRATAGEIALAAGIEHAWGSFARAGSPSASELPSWPRNDGAGEPYLELSSAPRVASALKASACDFWDRVAGE